MDCAAGLRGAGPEGVQLPGMQPNDRARNRASRRLAGGRSARCGRRPGGAQTLAHTLLEDGVSIEIRGPLELPALREDIELTTADELTLVGELAIPEATAPVATLVTLHPLPTAGGFMDSHILRKAAARLLSLIHI